MGALYNNTNSRPEASVRLGASMSVEWNSWGGNKDGIQNFQNLHHEFKPLMDVWL